MPKRPAAGFRGSGRAAKRSRRRQLLYLVMGDWEKGYSIRRVDLEEDYDADTCTDEQQQVISIERRLPPAVLHLEAPHDGGGHFAAAFGTKIIALHRTPRRYFPVFDVRSRCLSFGPRLKRDPCAPIYVPLGDKLFCLDFDTFEVLHQPPPPINPYTRKIVPKWSPWRPLSMPPFKHEYVTSHAVHPDGRTIFVSVDSRNLHTTETGTGSRKRKTGTGTGSRKRKTGTGTVSRKRKTETGTGSGTGTFTFDTAAVARSSRKWTRRGEWQLPFKGRAHYDHELDAWVGLTNDPDTLGHLCSCDVLPTDAKQPPAWKLSKDKLFCKDPAEKHTGAALVYLGMGHRSKFCLVQCLSLDEGHLLRLTTFSLKYDKNGDLRTATHHRVRSFELPKAVTECSDFLTNPVAFWM